MTDIPEQEKEAPISKIPVHQDDYPFQPDWEGFQAELSGILAANVEERDERDPERTPEEQSIVDTVAQVVASIQKLMTEQKQPQALFLGHTNGRPTWHEDKGFRVVTVPTSLPLEKDPDAMVCLLRATPLTMQERFVVYVVVEKTTVVPVEAERGVTRIVHDYERERAEAFTVLHGAVVPVGPIVVVGMDSFGGGGDRLAIHVAERADPPPAS